VSRTGHARSATIMNKPPDFSVDLPACDEERNAREPDKANQ